MFLPPRWVIVPTALVASTSGYATTYLTLEQAQAAIFPKEHWTAAPRKLAPEQRKAIEAKCGLRVRTADVRAWRTGNGGWLLIDEVLGKHEMITYACGIGADGKVTGIEIMDYRETYGGEIRNASWRHQFIGKSAASPLILDDDIRNIGGATLSSRHITDGIKRLLATYEIVLKNLP